MDYRYLFVRMLTGTAGYLAMTALLYWVLQ